MENKYNKKYFILSNTFDLVIYMTPTVTVFLIFILKIIVEPDKTLEMTMVYTILSFVGMTYTPIRSLMATVVSTLDGVAAFKKLEMLFKAREFV